MFTEKEDGLLIKDFNDCNFKDLATRLKKKQSEIRQRCLDLKLDRQEPQIGDVIKGWKILEIFTAEDNLTYAKIISTLKDCQKEKILRLTRIKFRKFGWPDRRRPFLSEKNKKHGLSNHPLYSVWAGMKTRCTNPNIPNYHNYGGKGIKIHEEWLNFDKFCDWCMENGWDDGLTLDRIDGSGNYCPENCRFITPKEQNDNRRISLNLTAFGETKNASDWSLDNRCNTSYASLCYRVNHGWNHEKAISTPSHTASKFGNFRKYKTLFVFMKEKYPEIVDEFLNNNY